MGDIGTADLSSYAKNSLAGQDPNAMIKSYQEVERNQLGIDSAKLGLVTTQMKLLGEGLGSLASDPNLTKQKIYDNVQNWVKQGLIPAKVGAQEMSRLTDNMDDNRQLLKEHTLRVVGSIGQLQQLYGQPQIYSNGQTDYPAQVGELGMRQLGAGVQRQVSPEFGASPQNYNLPSGQQVQATTAQRNAAAGAPLPVSPTQIAPVGNSVRGGVSALSGGMPQPVAAPSAIRLVKPKTNALGGVISAPGEQPTIAPAIEPKIAPKADAAPPGILGPMPGTVEAAKITGEAAGTALASDTDHAAKLTERTFPLMKAITSLEKLGKTGTGPGTETVNDIKSFIQSAGIPGIDADKITNYDEAKKYLTDYVNRTGNSGTNDKLAAAFAGNPSTKISNAAAVDVAKSAVALDRMRAAQAKAFLASGLPQSDYSKWASNWNGRQDVRAYAIDLMGAEKAKKLVDGLKDKERETFMDSFKNAHTTNVLGGR